MAADGFNSGDGSKNAATDPGSNIAIGQIVLGAVVGIVLGVLASHFIKGPSPAPPPSRQQRVTHYHYADNGVKDEEWEYKQGRLVCHKIDRNLDGSFDHWVYYNDAGYITRVEDDNNFDGKADEFYTYSNNEPIGMEKDTDFNGVPDVFVAYKFYVTQEADIRPNGSSFTTTREFFTNGVLAVAWKGGDASGHFKEAITYDAFNNPIGTNSFSQPLLTVPGR